VEIDRGTDIIDGLFWCEDEEGNVVNDVTGNNIIADLSKSCPQFYGKATPIYMSAQPEDEERFIQQEMKMIDRNIAKNGAKNYYDYLDSISMNGFDCFQNAVLTHHKTGSRIRYGHFGLLKPDGFIYWLFGHPDNTFDDFKTPKGITKSAHTRETRASAELWRKRVVSIEEERADEIAAELATKRADEIAAELATKRAAEIAAELAAEISSVSSSDSSVQSKEEKKKEQTRKANNKRDAKRREQEAFNEQVKAAARAIQEQERLKKEKKFRAQQKKIKEAKAAAEAEEYADMPPLVAPLKVKNA